MSIDETTDAPKIERTEYDATTGATIRLRANSKRTAKDGWQASEITVEFSGPADAKTTGLFYHKTSELHHEMIQACNAMDAKEGR